MFDESACIYYIYITDMIDIFAIMGILFSIKLFTKKKQPNLTAKARLY